VSFTSEQDLAAIVGVIELYEVVFVDGTEYYSSGTKDIVPHIDINPAAATYVATPITRDKIKKTHRARSSKVQVVMPVKSTTFASTLLDGGLGPVTFKIIRGFGDPVTEPLNFSRYWVQGELTEIAVRSGIALATFATSERLFEQAQVPSRGLSRTCDWGLYSNHGDILGTIAKGTVSTPVKYPACGLLESDYEYTFTVDLVEDNGHKITCTPDDVTSGYDLPDKATDAVNELPPVTGHFTFGKLAKTGTVRASHILSHAYDDVADRAIFNVHVSDPVTVANPNGIKVGDSITCSWGCDKKGTTCRLKFLVGNPNGNIANFLGAPRFPQIDPVTTDILFQKSPGGPT
jgi:hypothetical protein